MMIVQPETENAASIASQILKIKNGGSSSTLSLILSFAIARLCLASSSPGDNLNAFS